MSALRIGIRAVLWTAAIISLLAVLGLIYLAASDDRSDGATGSAILIAAIVAAWLAGYRLVREWKREALAVSVENALPIRRRVLSFAVLAASWLLIIGISAFLAGALVYGLTHPWRLSYDDWGEPRVLAAISLLSFVALIPLFLLDRLQRYSYRLHRARWTSLPPRIAHGVSRMVERDRLLLITLGACWFMGFVLMVFQSLLSEAGLSHPLIGISLAALLGLSVAAGLVSSTMRRGRIELVLDDAGLHFAFGGWSVPWSAILDVRLITFRFKLAAMSQLSLVIDRPERFGIHVGTGWWSWLCRWPMTRSNAWVPLYLFLERPKHIVADVKAFMTRAKSEGTAAGTPSGP